jgi:hypothetical protein
VDFAEARKLVGGTSGMKQLGNSRLLHEKMAKAWQRRSGAPTANLAAMVESLGKKMDTMVDAKHTAAPPAPLAQVPYAPPAGTMNVNVETHVDVLAEKRGLERELEVRKEYDDKWNKRQEEETKKQTVLATSLARIAEQKATAEQNKDPFESVGKLMGVVTSFMTPMMNAMNSNGAYAPSSQLAIGGSAPLALPPPPPRTDSDLPPGWEAAHTTEGTYYCNRETGQSQYVQNG